MSVPQRIGRYEILEELGRGAMGTVYRAKDPTMDRIVAVKTIISAVLASENGGEMRERFFREARAAGALTHPGIVPVFDVGEHEGNPFLVMEFVSGWTLANVAEKGERLDLNRMCEIGQKIAEALGYAHQRGVVHRDIKPANILLTSRQVYGVERPKITDFGIAKLTESEATMTGKMLGTPAFMPPEQFTGAPIDGRADIFSLGVVLYWLATGEQPFPGEGLTAVMYKVVHTDPIPPRKLNPSLPARFESIIMKCIEKDPAARYQTGEELAAALKEVRTASTVMNLANPPPLSTVPEGDSDATMLGSIRIAPPVESVTQAAAGATLADRPNLPADVSAPPRKNNYAWLLGACALALIAVGGWYGATRSRMKPVDVAATVSPASANPVPVVTLATPPQTATASNAVAGIASDAKAAAPAPNPHPTVDAAKPRPTAPPKAAATPATKAAVPVKQQSAEVDFDPMTLDPKHNARLKIDRSRMPSTVDYTVEMNGKVYLRRNGGNTNPPDSFVPPGVHEFRVTARSESVVETSNTVSADFKEKKKYTLMIELRLQGMNANAGLPQGLYPGTQIVLTLK
jgi:serine/threonine-protein kinase